MAPFLARGVGVVVLLMLAAVRGLATAHGILLDSTPKASDTVPEGVAFIDLRFNARIESGLWKVRLTGPLGEDVALAEGSVKSGGSGRLTALLPPLTPGLHIVHWQIFTRDGHLSRGRFSAAAASPVPRRGAPCGSPGADEVIW